MSKKPGIRLRKRPLLPEDFSTILDTRIELIVLAKLQPARTQVLRKKEFMDDLNDLINEAYDYGVIEGHNNAK